MCFRYMFLSPPLNLGRLAMMLGTGAHPLDCSCQFRQLNPRGPLLRWSEGLVPGLLKKMRVCFFALGMRMEWTEVQTAALPHPSLQGQCAVELTAWGSHYHSVGAMEKSCEQWRLGGDDSIELLLRYSPCTFWHQCRGSGLMSNDAFGNTFAELNHKWLPLLWSTFCLKWSVCVCVCVSLRVCVCAV